MGAAEIVECIQRSGGVASAAFLRQCGFKPSEIDTAYVSGYISRPTRGVYSTSGIQPDRYALVTIRWRKCVLSLGSSLFLLGLADEEPDCLDVTVPHGCNPSALVKNFPGTKVHHVTPKVHEAGVTLVKSPTGYPARAYDAERSLAGLIRMREKPSGSVDAGLIRTAITGYFARSDRDLDRLSAMCELLGVRSQLDIYLELFA